MSSRKNSVMIVNDNPDLVNLFKIALEQERIETHAFTDSTLALKKIKSNPDQFSLVIINYATQLKIGAERKFAKEAKAINEHIKVVLTSGYDFSADDVSMGGYDNFLQLPVKLSTLVSTVKDMLGS